MVHALHLRVQALTPHHARARAGPSSPRKSPSKSSRAMHAAINTIPSYLHHLIMGRTYSQPLPFPQPPRRPPTPLLLSSAQLKRLAVAQRLPTFLTHALSAWFCTRCTPHHTTNPSSRQPNKAGNGKEKGESAVFQLLSKDPPV